MAQWEKVEQLGTEAQAQIHSIYGDHFPIEVRYFLAQWLEEKIWMDVPEGYDGTQRDAFVLDWFRAFIGEMEEKANSLTPPYSALDKIKLKNAARDLQSRYQNDPYRLLNTIRQCLTTELQIVGQCEQARCPGIPLNFLSDPGPELAKQFQDLRERTEETAQQLRNLAHEQESYLLMYHEATKINAQLAHMQNAPKPPHILEAQEQLNRHKNNLDATLRQKVLNLIQLRLTFVDKLKDTINQLMLLQRRVLDDELLKWKREQQLSGNGATITSNLDTIQEWCENLAELIWLNRQQMKELEVLKRKVPLEAQGTVDILTPLENHVTQLLSTLVTSTFIIEKQPPQVMKTNTRFTSTVRLLVGGKLNVQMSNPQVEASIISEAQANALLQNDRTSRSGDGRNVRNEVSGEIINNSGRMDYVQQTRQLTVQFRNMQLKKIKRAEKKGTESVMDEKFSLFFQTQFSVGTGELMFQVWTLSLPVVVIVHGNQEPHAWATVTWDNAFAEPGRTPFTVPDRVQWSEVASALSCKFHSVTGRSLTQDNLRFLGEKAFRRPPENDTLLTWSQFCKELLPDRSFTFWDWFYAVMKLTKEHLRGPWCDGSIIGFIKKQEAENILAGQPCGTFLLRFSDSELGGVTIAWVAENSEVLMIHPFTSKDFAIRSMADRIADLNQLVNLYPDIPKDTVFNKYYTPPVPEEHQKGGYVKPVLVTQVPGHTHSFSTPGTPHMHQPLSPDGRVLDEEGLMAMLSAEYGDYSMDYKDFNFEERN